MKDIGIIFPHQLFEINPLFEVCKEIYLVEEWLFFKQYPFHKRKIAFHRASMKFYENYLSEKGIKVNYIESQHTLSDIRNLIAYLGKQKVEAIHLIESTDNWLEARIITASQKAGIKVHTMASPQFLNTKEELFQYFEGRKKLFQTDFYKDQRKKRKVLIDNELKPAGGKWTFDDENRLKYPKDKKVPTYSFAEPDEWQKEALTYTQLQFSSNLGQLDQTFNYPVTFKDAKTWLQQFFETRFAEFGDYEDAIVVEKILLHHSLLTPMLNSGLLTPQYVMEEALAFARQQHIPINSLEGFVRQLMGWREFIRAVYELKGTEERTKNYWNFKRKIPASFYTGETGIQALDETIKKVLKTGYCHHIERLMVLGNFMQLCEFDPDEVYRWFMELFIDAYDWVMVPNVYGMSQFADGGLMATKPYISGSNYLMKMSNYQKGNWQLTWDALFWRFMHVHRDFFLQNPRLGMLVKTFDKMPAEKRQAHLSLADKYLNTLSLPT